MASSMGCRRYFVPSYVVDDHTMLQWFTILCASMCVCARARGLAFIVIVDIHMKPKNWIWTKKETGCSAGGDGSKKKREKTWPANTRRTYVKRAPENWLHSWSLNENERRKKTGEEKMCQLNCRVAENAAAAKNRCFQAWRVASYISFVRKENWLRTCPFQRQCVCVCSRLLNSCSSTAHSFRVLINALNSALFFFFSFWATRKSWIALKIFVIANDKQKTPNLYIFCLLLLPFGTLS